ncbi:hypothetical protein MW887_009926 [Aspergillus wentii]|nr:hypothetical protein MW887_009926 [Aspergillus wentii]
MRWISLQPALNHTHRRVAGTKKSLFMPWDDGDDDKNNDQNNSPEDKELFSCNPQEFWRQKKSREYLGTLRYTPSQGPVHFFTYKGSWVALYRQPYKQTGSPLFANMERLYFYAVPWKRHVLNDIIHEIRETPVNRDPEQVAVYGGLRQGSSFEWVHIVSNQARFLSTVVLDHDKKMEVIQDITEYLDPDTRSWYQSRGLPYRRGYLFHGPPGTGKSSLCMALASMVHLDIYTVSLNAAGLDENSLALLFQSLPPSCIVLLEDIDEAGIQKRSGNGLPVQETDPEGKSSQNRDGSIQEPLKSPWGITLSGCLNVIDGVAAQEGRILIMTTNHLERLDSALLRPGRVDMKIHMGPLNREEAKQVFLMFYLQPTNNLFMEVTTSSVPVKPDWDPKEIDHLSIAFTDIIPPCHFTAAELQRHLLHYKYDPSAAVRNVAGWLFNLHCETDLSAFRVIESPHQFGFYDTSFCIRVSAHVFSWPDDGKNETAGFLKPHILLLQRAPCDTNPGFWEVAGGRIEKQDEKPRSALEREVQEETGLQLSRVIHALPTLTWRRSREGGWQEWVGLPYIIEVSEAETSNPHANSEGVSQSVTKWEDAVRLNPKEHQDFAWATEEEVQHDKYPMFGNHKETILEAFAVVTQNRSV